MKNRAVAVFFPLSVCLSLSVYLDSLDIFMRRTTGGGYYHGTAQIRTLLTADCRLY